MSTDLTIVQGDTFLLAARWEQPTFSYVPIAAITNAAPVNIQTQATHGIPNGWRVQVQSALGMTAINAADLSDKSFVQATVVDTTHITINSINSLGFKTHTASTGVVVFRTPVDLAGYTARMQIKDKIGGTVLLSSEIGDAPLNLITLPIDTVNYTIGIQIAATATAAITWKAGVYDLELISGTGVVTKLLSGKVAITKEVTTGP